MDIEHGQSNVKQDQLLEIYKLHVQQTNNMSNRRAAASRFYQLALSGLFIVFFTFVQHKGQILPKELSDKLTIGFLMCGFGYAGLHLSWIWFISIDVYLDAISRKYDVLKKLETQLEFQFLTEEWELLDEKRKKQSYRKLAAREVFLPYFFFGIFFLLFIIGSLKTIDVYLFLPLFLPVFLISVYMLINMSVRVKKE